MIVAEALVPNWNDCTGNNGRAAPFIIFLSELMKEEKSNARSMSSHKIAKAGVRKRAERNPPASVYVHRFPYVVVDIRCQCYIGVTTDNRWSGNRLRGGERITEIKCCKTSCGEYHINFGLKSLIYLIIIILAVFCHSVFSIHDNYQR